MSLVLVGRHVIVERVHQLLDWIPRRCRHNGLAGRLIWRVQTQCQADLGQFGREFANLTDNADGGYRDAVMRQVPASWVNQSSTGGRDIGKVVEWFA